MEKYKNAFNFTTTNLLNNKQTLFSMTEKCSNLQVELQAIKEEKIMLEEKVKKLESSLNEIDLKLHQLLNSLTKN